MAEPDHPAEPAPKRRRFWPLLLGCGAALFLGGGAFYATYSGMISLPGASAATAQPAPSAFVQIPPIVVAVGSPVRRSHLRFAAQLEVDPARAAMVTEQMPRILDVLNSYLHALEPHQLEEAGALARLRGQMLRRLKMVLGEERVNDLLITEFVMN
ncbi:flagellar basal body-associated FliL family protein [Halodurantibacterium flavum]|uniref:Flagellar protein FliL n=1 Tax=Halodurantibacterium flavum TaxID=1382802 RepID=A0ABW4SAI5_9RHOB